MQLLAQRKPQPHTRTQMTFNNLQTDVRTNTQQHPHILLHFFSSVVLRIISPSPCLLPQTVINPHCLLKVTGVRAKPARTHRRVGLRVSMTTAAPAPVSSKPAKPITLKAYEPEARVHVWGGRVRA